MKKVHIKFASLLLVLSLLFASFFSVISTSHPVFADPIPSNAAPSANPDQTTPDNASGNQGTNTTNPNAANPTPNTTNPGTTNTTDGSTNTDATSTKNQEPVTCTSQIGAVGWIICPTTGLLAKGIDALYGIIENLLSVKPLEMGRNSPVYQVWAYMRNLANICFIIFLLVIIYSQITGLGINNYGIKKSLPRLIITAIIVNFSFLFCAIAVDISNIIGNGLKDLLAGIAENAISTGTIDPSKNTGFYALFTTIAAGGIGTTILLAFPGGPLGLLLAIIPVIVGGIISVVIGLLVLGLRQALVVFLVAISPVAFVLYILPNTEKHFQKWKNYFAQMLFFYPMFSMLFGVTKLASMIFITSATTPFGVIIGVAIQVLPLFLAANLMQLSGTALGGISSKLNGLGNKASVGVARSIAPMQALNRQKAIENAMKRKRVMNLLPWYWGGAMAANSALMQHRHEDELKTRDDTLRRYRDEDLEAQRRGARILYRDKDGRAVYDKRVYGKEGDLERTTDFVDPKNKIMEYTYQNRVAKLAADAQHIKTEDALGNMSDYLHAYSPNQNPYLEQLAKNQTENFLDLKTAESSKKRNDYNANKFYAAKVREASKINSDGTPVDSELYEKYVVAGAGTDTWALNNGQLTEQQLTDRHIALQLVTADAVDVYESERKSNINKLSNYMDTMVTKDVINAYQLMYKNKSMDGIIAGNNVLARRGDYDKIMQNLRDYMDEGNLQLTTSDANMLALNLMAMKDADPTLGRLGKYINMETWQYTSGNRKTQTVTMEQYYTGRIEQRFADLLSEEDKQREEMYETKIKMSSGLKGTKFDKIDRTATSSIMDTIQYYDTKIAQYNDERIKQQHDAIFDAIRPALISAIPTFPSGSEQLVNVAGMLAGLGRKDWQNDKKIEDNIGNIAKSETAAEQIRSYLKSLTAKDAAAMKSDMLEAIRYRLIAEHFDYNPNDYDTDEERQTAKQKAFNLADQAANNEIIKIFTKNKVIETLGRPNSNLFDGMKTKLKDILEDAVEENRKTQIQKSEHARQEARQNPQNKPTNDQDNKQ